MTIPLWKVMLWSIFGRCVRCGAPRLMLREPTTRCAKHFEQERALRRAEFALRKVERDADD